MNYQQAKNAENMLASGAVASRTPIQDALSKLSDAHRRLANEVDRAHAKFQTVLSPSPPANPQPGNDFPHESELYVILMGAANFANMQADALCDLNNRSTL